MAGPAELRERLTAILAPVLAADGVDLEAVEVASAGRRRVLRLVVDADGGVALDLLGQLSRTASKVLDETDVMGSGPYTLEVTSRGVDRPLTEPRHWRRNVGRKVEVLRTDGGRVTGRILDPAEGAARLDVGHDEPLVLPFDQVEKARVQVEFKAYDEEGE